MLHHICTPLPTYVSVVMQPTINDADAQLLVPVSHLPCPYEGVDRLVLYVEARTSVPARGDLGGRGG